MVIDMNEVQVSTVEKMRQVLAGTQALEFRQAGDDAGGFISGLHARHLMTNWLLVSVQRKPEAVR